MYASCGFQRGDQTPQVGEGVYPFQQPPGEVSVSEQTWKGGHIRLTWLREVSIPTNHYQEKSVFQNNPGHIRLTWLGKASTPTNHQLEKSVFQNKTWTHTAYPAYSLLKPQPSQYTTDGYLLQLITTEHQE